MINLQKLFICFTITIVAFLNSHAQSLNKRLNCLQGVWYYEDYRGIAKSFMIYKKNRVLSFGYDTEGDFVKFPIRVYLFGFVEEDINTIDSLNINTIKHSGKNYVEFPENTKIYSQRYIKEFNVPLSFGCEEDVLSVLGAKLTEYRKIDYIPLRAILLLEQRGEINKRNYLKEFINKPKIKIKNEKVSMYYTNLSLSHSYLKKSDIVEYIAHKGSWIRIKGPQSSSYFIKSVDVEP